MFYHNCQKRLTFRYFDEGKRPAEIYSLLPSLKKTTIIRYHQQWKRQNEARERAAETGRMRQILVKRIHSVDLQILQIVRYGRPEDKKRLPFWRGQKARAELLLKNPSLLTDRERELLHRQYDDEPA